jgi:hypothetical protein
VRAFFSNFPFLIIIRASPCIAFLTLLDFRLIYPIINVRTLQPRIEQTPISTLILLSVITAPPIAPNVMADTKLKKVICPISFLPSILVNNSKEKNVKTSLITSSSKFNYSHHPSFIMSKRREII